MKKQTSKTKRADSASATIVFRPGVSLGETLGELADKWEQSRGEVAKRLVALAVHDLNLDFIPVIEQLVDLGYGGVTFDAACHQAHVVIAERAGSGKETLSNADRLALVREHVGLYRRMRDVEDKAERTRLTVKLVRQ